MSGEIIHIYDPPTDEEINQKEPTSIFYPRATRDLLTSHGGVHGQKIKGRISLNFDSDDEDLPIKKDEVWEVELEMNDNLECMWIVAGARKID